MTSTWSLGRTMPLTAAAPEQLTEVILHDKKAAADGIDCVLVEKIGSFEIVRLTEKEIRARIAAAFAEDRL